MKKIAHLTVVLRNVMFLTFILLGCGEAMSQCAEKNTAFQSGEILKYELYFNWKFVWLKAGTASMTTVDAEWEGKKVYKSDLLTQSSKRLDKYFMMRDTLQCVVSKDLVPLYYKKAANEGGKYYVDQVWYSYADGKTSLKQEYLSRRGKTTHASYQSSECIYDMMSMMLRARSFEASKFQKGDKLQFSMADGRNVENSTLVYRGKKNFRMKGSDTTYRCLIFSFVEYEDKKEKEIITFYITDDENHTPVRLDMFLKFGTAKAYLSEAKGLRHESTSIVRE